MRCFLIDPWGLTIPALFAQVSDPCYTGQTLRLLHIDEKGEMFSFGADLMPKLRLSRESWPGGFRVLKDFTQDPGFLIQVSFWNLGRSLFYDEMLRGTEATLVETIFEPSDQKIICKPGVHPKQKPHQILLQHQPRNVI